MPRMWGLGLGLYAFSTRIPNLDLWQVHIIDSRGFGSSVSYGHYGLGFQAWCFLLLSFCFGYYYAHTCLQPPSSSLPLANTSTVHTIVNIHYHIKINRITLFLLWLKLFGCIKVINSSNVVYYTVTCIERDYYVHHVQGLFPIFFKLKQPLEINK